MHFKMVSGPSYSIFNASKAPKSSSKSMHVNPALAGLLLLLLNHFDDDSQSERIEEAGSISRNLTNAKDNHGNIT